MSLRLKARRRNPSAAPYLILLFFFFERSPVRAMDFSGPANPATRPSAASQAALGEEPCAELEKQAAAAREAPLICRDSIETARCILSTACSDSLTHELCGAAESDEGLREDAARALACLDRAEAALGRMHTTAEADEARECIEMLRSFAKVFRALGAAPATGPSRDGLLAACSDLAGYFDDSRIGIAESAKLWQGVAYRRAGRPDRALQVLRPAISVPASRRIGLWARLERCRALADQGDYAEALAMNLRLSVRVDAWFEDEDPTTRRQAVDSIRWVRIELLKRWGEHLKQNGQTERAAEAEADADRMLGSDSWPVEPDRWLGLGPPVADLPDCLAATTSRPTTAP